MAAWLAEVASPGQVLISGRTYSAAGNRFEVTPRGEQVVQGSEVKTSVFEVRGEDLEPITRPGVS
jgi:class 3 adenylate cyclase